MEAARCGGNGGSAEARRGPDPVGGAGTTAGGKTRPITAYDSCIAMLLPQSFLDIRHHAAI